MRVVAGELRGRRLESPGRGVDVRPTADRVREALFSILADVSGDRVLDLFCGTGALAIEALSRGAVGAVLVDVDTSIAQRNVSELGLEARCEIVSSDALRFLRSTDERFDLVLCDPPYRLADRLEPDLDKLIAPCLATGGRAVIESAARRPLALTLALSAERRYGETLVRVYEAAEPR